MSGPSRLFRPSPSRSPLGHVARTAVQIALFWTLFLAVIPALIVRAERALELPNFTGAVPPAIAWSLFTIASALGLWSGITMALAGRGTPLPTNCPTRLVVSGPYSHTRNPMAMAGLAQGAAVGLLLGSYGVLAYCLCGGILWNTIIRPLEEADLSQRFGADYERYRSHVRCWRWDR